VDAVEPVHAPELVLRALDVGGVGAKFGTFLITSEKQQNRY